MVTIALFDLDNTLIDRNSAFRRWTEAFVAREGLDEAGIDWICTQDEDGFATREALFEAARRRFGIARSVDALIVEYRTEYPRHFSPDESVLSALRSLRSTGWRIGIVTNGPPTQAEKVKRTGLVQAVDAVCISGEIGWEKPDPRIFADAVRRCAQDAEPGTVWMTGDSAVPDILGGQQAGCRTIWCRRGRAWSPQDYAPDASVDSVEEAIASLLRSNRVEP